MAGDEWGNEVSVGNVRDVSGDVNIAGGNIIKGFTDEQFEARISQIATQFQQKPFDGRCPYKGLEAFQEQDAEYFFGRESQVQDIIERARHSRAIFIAGPSGSGKSSLVRAGVIHALKQGALQEPHSERWLYATIRPGRDPLEALALAFSRLKSPELADYLRKHNAAATVLNDAAESALSDQEDQRLVLFIDQFEETFTQAARDKADALIELLTGAATTEGGRVILLLALRSDFIPNCTTYPELNALLNKEFMQVGAMQPTELINAIALPAQHVGLRIDPDLIKQMVSDMHGEPGALPLMQFALKELFDEEQARGQVNALTLASYLDRKGIREMLARYADQTLSGLDAEDLQLARSIFGGLVQIGSGRQDTRRSSSLDQLTPANAKTGAVEAIVQRLEDARLITTEEQDGQEKITLSHEILIDAWPWLRKLINENRDAIALQNEIANEAKEWVEHGRDASYLYSGAKLANAREQLEAERLVLGGEAEAFVHASRARQQRNQVGLIASVSVLIVLLSILAIVFANLASEAQRQATISRAGELSAESVSVRDGNFALSLLLGVAAFDEHDSIQSRSVLLDNTQFSPQLQRQLFGHNGSMFDVAFSPDGAILASASTDHTIILWDVATGRQIGKPLQEGNLVSAVAFSPSGKLLAAGDWSYRVVLWDVATQKLLVAIRRPQGAIITDVAFNPAGTTLAVSSGDGIIFLWDVAAAKQIGPPLLHAGTTSVNSIAFSPNGKMLASASPDGSIILWDAVGAKEIAALPNESGQREWRSVAFSPSGQLLVSAGSDNFITLWDVAGGQVSRLLPGHTGGVYAVAFSPDGSTLASTGVDGSIRFWDISTGKEIGQPLKGYPGPAHSLAYSPKGDLLATGGSDYSVEVWDTAVRQPIARALDGHAGALYSVQFSPDGGLLAAASEHGSVILWDTASGLPAAGSPLQAGAKAVSSVAFSPDGSTLAAGGDDNVVTLWDVSSRKAKRAPLPGIGRPITSIAFSPDGKTLAAGTGNYSILFWDVKSGQPLGPPLQSPVAHLQAVAFEAGGPIDYIRSVAISPDGKLLAAGSEDGTITLWDVLTRKMIGPPLNGNQLSVGSVAFSPDGKLLASAGENKTVILWDVATRKPLGPPLQGHSETVSELVFDPHGDTIASGSFDGSVRLWDVASHQPVGQGLLSDHIAVQGVAFSQDGKELASAHQDGTVLLWNLDTEFWKSSNCQHAGRNFTREEWAQYFPDEPYPTNQKDATCPQWPLEPEPAAATSP